MSATNYSQRTYNSFAAGNASVKANNTKTKSTKSNKYESTSSPSSLTSKNAADESNEMSDAISKEDKVFSSYLFMLRMADNFAKQLNYHESIRSAEAALFLRIRKANIIESKLKEVATQNETESKSQSTHKEIDESNQGKTKVKKSKQHHRHSTHTEQEETTPPEPTQRSRSHKTKKMSDKKKMNENNNDTDNYTGVDKEPSFLYSALHHSVIEQVKELLLRCNTYAVEEFSHNKYESASFFLDKALFLTSERTYLDAEEESELTDESKKEQDDDEEEEKRNEKEEEELWNASSKTSIAGANVEKGSDSTEKCKDDNKKRSNNNNKRQLIVLFHQASDSNSNNNNSEEIERLRLHAATLNNFGCMERRRGRYIKSLEYFQQAIRVQIGLTNDVMYTYTNNNNINSNSNSNRQDHIVQKVNKEEGDLEERKKGTNDEREAVCNEEICMDKLPSLLLSLASSYCNLNLLYNDMFMYGEAVAAAQRAIHVLEQAQETMTEMEHLLLIRSKSKNRKECSGTTTTTTTKTKTETKMLLRMLMMAYHNMGISLMRKSEASNNTTTNMANKFYQAGSMGSNTASLQSTLIAASAANDQEEVLLAQHAFEHAQSIRNRLALIEHKSTNKGSDINTYNNTSNINNSNSSEKAKTTINAKEESHLEKKERIDNEFQLTLQKQNVSETSQKEVKNAMQTPLHIEEETHQMNAKSNDLQHLTSLNNSDYNVHSVINATTTPERLAQTCSPLTLNAALQHKTNNLIETENQQSDETKDIIEYSTNVNDNNDQSDYTRNAFMSTAPAKLYNECAMESNDAQAANSQPTYASQSLQQCVENNKSPKEEENNSHEEKQIQKPEKDEEEKGAGVALPPINKCSSTNTARDKMYHITKYMESDKMMSKEKERVNHDECVNNTSNKDNNLTAPATSCTTLSLPALEERKNSKTQLTQENKLQEKELEQYYTNDEPRTTNDIHLVNSKESDKENKMDGLSNNHENDKLPHTQTSSSPLLPPVHNTHSNKGDNDENNDENDYKNDLCKRISLTKEFDARNASLSLVQNHKPSPGSSQSQRQRRSILDRINDRLKSTNSLNKNLNSYNNNTLANYNRLSTTSSAMPEGNLFANAARKKSSLVASVNSINNNNNNVRNKRHSRKSLIASKNKLYRKEQVELANQMISALEHKVQLEEKQQRRRAAIAIQKIVKGVLVRTKLSLKLNAVLLLQRNVRIFLGKVRIIHAHEALIQQKEEQRRKEKELKAAILIQRRLRSFLQRLHEKQEIEAQARRLHRAACTIQEYYRKYCTRKLIKQQEEQRAHELAKRQEQFIQRHAALRIAHAYKSYKHKCAELARKEQLELEKGAALVIQSHWRGAQARAWYYYALRASRERQLQSAITQSFVTVIQRYVECVLAQRHVYHHECLQLMESYRLKLHHAAVTIQSCWRGHVGRIHAERVRFAHACACRHAMCIQQWWRARMARCAFVEHYNTVKQNKVALCIQKWWMQCREDRKAHEFASYHARLLEQQRLRAVRVMCAQTLKRFVECKQSLQFVQNRRELLIKRRYACQLIQRASRGFQLRRGFQLEQEAIQRCILQERQEQIQKYAAQVIQRAWRRAWSKILEEQELINLHAVGVIESAWQIYKCKCVRNELAVAKRHALENHAAVIIQRALRHWRRRIILHDLADYYTQRQRMHKCLLRKNEAVTQIAACWRGYVTRRELENDRMQWHKMNVSAFTIQHAWHKYLTAKEKKRIDAERRNYDIRIRENRDLEELHKEKAALCIQCAYRRLRARQCVHSLRSWRIKSIHAAIRIQCAWRVHVAHTKLHFLQACQAEKDALAVETLLQWNRFMTTVQCFIKAIVSHKYIQSQYHTYLYNKLDERVRIKLERRVHAAICIQSLYRGHLGRRYARSVEMAQWREHERLAQLAASQAQQEQILLRATLQCQRIGKGYIHRKNLAYEKMEAEQHKAEKDRIMPPERVVQQLFAQYNASQNQKILLGKRCQVFKRKWAARIIERAIHSYLHTLHVREYNVAKQKENAASCILHYWRLYKERKMYKEQEQRQRAAIVIQRTIRMYLAQKEAQTMRENLHEERIKRLEMYAILDHAAGVIQNQWRVMHARRDALLRKREREAKRAAEQRNEAASVIQQAYRNYRERCRV